MQRGLVPRVRMELGTNEAIKEAILAGVDSIEHASLIDEEAIALAPAFGPMGIVVHGAEAPLALMAVLAAILGLATG